MRLPLNNPPIGQPFASTEVDYRPFGMVGHNGQDFPVGVGTPVYAPESGIVRMSANGVRDQYTGNNISGETIVIVGGYEHWLLHNSQRLVQQGTNVKEGQLIAYSGATGFTDGPHVHWGVRPLTPNISNGYRGFIDPMQLMKDGDDMPAQDRQVRLLLFSVLGMDGLGVGGKRLNALDYKNPEVTRIVQSYIDKKVTTTQLLEEFWESAQGIAYRDIEKPNAYDMAERFKAIKDTTKPILGV